MKRFLVSSICAILSFNTYAQSEEAPTLEGAVVTNKEVVCTQNAKRLQDVLTGHYGERPILTFKSETTSGLQSAVSVWMDTKDGSTTIVESLPSGYHCILGYGGDAAISERMLRDVAKKGKISSKYLDL